MNDKIKPIAAYLPQFHPIPENDKWWGKGFTEWTNVAKARPLFNGHWQPRLPADLGFYDLRIPELREAQAQLAREYGIHGFCYWHYWFGGKRILERPLKEVISSGQPDFPFCMAWANQTWSGTWHGLSNDKILIEQTYPGEKDYEAHFYSLLEVFTDNRYIQVNDKKVFFVFRPMDIPEVKSFIDCWQQLAIKEGLNGFHFVGMHMPPDWQAKEYGFDAMIPGFFARENYKVSATGISKKNSLLSKLKQKLGMPGAPIAKNVNNLPTIVSYEKYVSNYPGHSLQSNQYPWIMPDWDNTARAGANGWLFKDSSPELFYELCMKAFKETENKAPEQKFVFIKSWNEWAEGNYLEPDQKFGLAYLEQFKKSLEEYNNQNPKASYIV